MNSASSDRDSPGASACCGALFDGVANHELVGLALAGRDRHRRQSLRLQFLVEGGERSAFERGPLLHPGVRCGAGEAMHGQGLRRSRAR